MFTCFHKTIADAKKAGYEPLHWCLPKYYLDSLGHGYIFTHWYDTPRGVQRAPNDTIKNLLGLPVVEVSNDKLPQLVCKQKFDPPTFTLVTEEK